MALFRLYPLMTKFPLKPHGDDGLIVSLKCGG